MKATWRRSGLLLFLSFALLVGCSLQTKKPRVQATKTDYAKVRDTFLSQEKYAFQGRTKQLTGTTANGNLVTFSGRVDGKSVLMNVDLSMPEEQRAKSLSLLSRPDRMYARVDGANAWQPVGPDDHALLQECNNWDPRFSFKQMEEMANSIIPLREDMGRPHLKAFKVVLDSNKLKSWLGTQLERQHTTSVHSQSIAHTPRIPLAVALSESRPTGARTGASVQTAGSKFEDVIKDMELEASYRVYYNQNTMLPTVLAMDIRSRYTMNNQRINEHSTVETYLLNYGQQQQLPEPTPITQPPQDHTPKLP